jgi:hypothetical protein
LAEFFSRFATADGGLVQVEDAYGNGRGMGFLVTRRKIVTCAHVVNVALQRDIDDTSPLPSNARLSITFPLAADLPEHGIPVLMAKVLSFGAPGRLFGNDIALLELDEDAPEEVSITVLSNLIATDLRTDKLDLFGPPAGGVAPIHFDGQFSGNVNQAWLQVDAINPRDTFVVPGFSGGRVWSFTHEATIGMVVAEHTGTTKRRAFMLPAASLQKSLQAIPSETRTVTVRFCQYWSIFASLYFLLILTHFLGERIGDYPAFLALGAGNSVVNGLHGLRICTVLLPFALVALIRFVRGFAQHPWWMRLPRYGQIAANNRTTTSRISAGLTIFLLLIFPLWAQGHFIDELFGPRIFIETKAFGYDSKLLKEHGEDCYGDRCTFRGAKVFDLVPAAEGHRAPYWNNAYHYGRADSDDRAPNTITFFPILEPSLYITVMMLNLILFANLLLRIARPPTWRLDSTRKPISSN